MKGTLSITVEDKKNTYEVIINTHLQGVSKLDSLILLDQFVRVLRIESSDLIDYAEGNIDYFKEEVIL